VGADSPAGRRPGEAIGSPRERKIEKEKSRTWRALPALPGPRPYSSCYRP